MVENKCTLLPIGVVENVQDKDNTGSIKVRLAYADKGKSTQELPDAFPLMPKFLHIKPKVGEYVLIVNSILGMPNSQRFYIGPIISQDIFLNKDASINALNALRGGIGKVGDGKQNDAKTFGAFANDDKLNQGERSEIALYGRLNTDIILGDNDLKLRCGARLMEGGMDPKVSFNRLNPAFIKLEYFPESLKIKINKKDKEVNSLVNVVGEFINLFSTNGDPNVTIGDNNAESNSDEMLTRKTLAEIMTKSHPLVKGDKLAELLYDLINLFLEHRHASSGNIPYLYLEDTTLYDNFNNKYRKGSKEEMEKFLCNEYIRMN